MLKLSNIKIPFKKYCDKALISACAAALGIEPSDILSLIPLKISIDSRKKPDVFYICTVALEIKNEAEVLSEYGGNDLGIYAPASYRFPCENLSSSSRPIVVGTGPAGLFSALCLAEAGIPCTIIERGKPVEERVKDVGLFWADGILNPGSNVQFGEGGAGTFSDGKLMTGINDERIPFVLRRFVEFGAPQDILYTAKPHIGTDMLRIVVKNMRIRLIELGCDILFNTVFTDIRIENGKLTGILLSSDDKFVPADTLILAPGNAARDTFQMLHLRGVPLESKNFAVGVRIEHLQHDIDMTQYGSAANHGILPPADYKLSAHLPDGRGVFSFCVCPGGNVVASASETCGVVTNGMSEHSRNGKNINGGLLVSVTPDDFGSSPLAGIDFQRSLERAAFKAGGGNYCAPAQTVGDFLKRQPSKSHGGVLPSYLPGVKYCNLWDVLPEFICKALSEALPLMDNKVHGFAAPKALLTAVETRSSSPVRILRDPESFMSAVSGIYPCGEGAGYAGGITSSAVDGIKCAEAVCRNLLW